MCGLDCGEDLILSEWSNECSVKMRILGGHFPYLYGEGEVKRRVALLAPSKGTRRTCQM